MRVLKKILMKINRPDTHGEGTEQHASLKNAITEIQKLLVENTTSKT